MDLVIVESPSKAKTIEKYLGKGYRVDASGGHVRDLPEKSLGVDVKHDFDPKYVVNPDKKSVIKRLSESVKKCDNIYLATDPDREGEAISWHLAETLGLKKGEYSRIEFNEISQKAVTAALQSPREIDMDLVNAQQARRVLDRLVGYKLSPYLCKKLQDKLSAGRVQSAALKMIVDREKEIKAFVPKEYWNIVAELFKEAEAKIVFKAMLAEFKGKKVKPGCKEEADEILKNLEDAVYRVVSVKKSQSKSHPLPPFTTSTMQQDASHKLGLTAPVTMQIAQQLYEGVEIAGEGQRALVTYIRTDSVRISADAQSAALGYIEEHFGKAFVPAKPNFYKSKKTAQDAHEAIRPINLAVTPESIKDKIQKNQYRLYKLVYDRFLASQMTDAVYNTMAVGVQAGDCLFKANGKALAFKGYTAVYDAVQQKSEEDESTSAKMPDLAEGDLLNLKKLSAEQKFTKPPARYSDATLIKAMEEKGIGRPSTYASIIGVLARRTYTTKEQKFLVPTERAFEVDEILEKYFGKIVDLTFTASMEEQLDAIEEGGKNWKEVIEGFYPWLVKHLEAAGAELVEETDVKCDKCGSLMLLRTGRYGKFLACSNYPTCNNTKPYDVEVSEVKCDKCGANMIVKTGRYGKYLACPNYPDCSNIKPYAQERLSEEHCPECGTQMVIRSGKYGEYLSCPNCKKNKPIVKAVGVCPKCGKPVAEKRSKTGKLFYGCTGYPACNFMSWDIPTDKKCPKCGKFLYLKSNKSGKRYQCSDPQCDYEQPVEEEKAEENAEEKGE